MASKYADSWAEYKRFGRYELFAAVGMLLTPILFFSIELLLKVNLPVYFVEVILFSAVAYFHYFRYIWPCPRCGEMFNGRFGIGGIREECQYCALPKWANDDGDAPTLKDNETRQME